MIKKLTRRILGHSLVRSLDRSHRSLIRSLCPACFARALCPAHFTCALYCAHSFARSLVHSLPSYWERGFFNEMIASISYNFNPLAAWMDPPDTQFLLEFVRPDFLLLRVLAKGLILWDQVMPSLAWFNGNIPEIILANTWSGTPVVVDWSLSGKQGEGKRANTCACRHARTRAQTYLPLLL